LKDVVLRSGGLADLPAPFRAKRVTIGIPIWDLVRGSFDAAQIRIEGLSLRVVTLSSGRQNLPARSGASGCPQLRGPAISIADANISVEDEPDGIAMEAQAVNAFGGSDVSAGCFPAHAQKVVYDSRPLVCKDSHSTPDTDYELASR
jgi:hypothetical protein